MNNPSLRTVIVSVDYGDYLAVTLPYNRHHFADVMVVTSPHDQLTLDVALENDCQCYMTEAFYRDGAKFNKWLALEEGLSVFGREGWMAIVDADVLWPKDLYFVEGASGKTVGYPDLGTTTVPKVVLHRGYLYTPLRHDMVDFAGTVPPEAEWEKVPLHRNQGEWAGYTQVFHAEDPHLPKGYWHETDWTHAGGADSFFQRLWPQDCKIRPPFNVLHLGPPGTNWMGRVTPYLTGERPAMADVRERQMREMMLGRRRAGRGRFEQEKIVKG